MRAETSDIKLKGSTMGKWELTKIWFKRHDFCILLMLIVVLIAVTVVLRGDEKDLVSYVSFATALAGGVLAIVVIVYTLIDSADIRTDLMEMRRLIAEVRGDIGKTANVLDYLVNIQSVLNIDSKSPVVHMDTEPVSEPSEIKSIPFTLSSLRIFPLLMVYCTVKSFQHKQKLTFSNIIERINPERDKNSAVIQGAIAVGIVSMCEGFHNYSGITFKGTTIVNITHIPNDIAMLVENEFDRRLNEPPIDHTYQAKLLHWKDTVEDYFIHGEEGPYIKP